VILACEIQRLICSRIVINFLFNVIPAFCNGGYYTVSKFMAMNAQMTPWPLPAIPPSPLTILKSKTDIWLAATDFTPCILQDRLHSMPARQKTGVVLSSRSRTGVSTPTRLACSAFTYTYTLTGPTYYAVVAVQQSCSRWVTFSDWVSDDGCWT
jgi:hypothetical protein